MHIQRQQVPNTFGLINVVIANRNVGFTLIELMAIITIAAILLVIGVPSFQETMRNNRVATQANQLISALTLARS
ncbi:MAG TPA: prepilin-type N-terminal cleavage/methylation domain-containing protein, partial [Candidatus Competibacteraceae bacterium]|nr:prepilin-type N-terminal cleavage/methylation domain-containing protein [Candidatus Competibacteraceae bacterium]